MKSMKYSDIMVKSGKVPKAMKQKKGMSGSIDEMGEQDVPKADKPKAELEISIDEMGEQDVPKADKLKMPPFKGTDSSKLLEIELELGSGKKKANAYDKEAGYFEVPMKGGKYTETGEEAKKKYLEKLKKFKGK